MDICRGTLQQAARISQLIFASEPKLLSFLFGGEARCRSYLQKACARPQGQFSANYHWLALRPSKVITSPTQESVAGVCATWLYNMPNEFQEGTVSALRDLLELDQIIHLLAYKDDLDNCFVPPEQHQLCIGHVSIDVNYAREGIATALLDHAISEARRQSKSELILDVGVSNANAISCYEKAGFKHSHERVFEATQQRFSRMLLPL